jgi:ribonuclease BN (tRNA processing enzyme)
MISPEWKQYRKSFHTSSKELAAIANKSKPGLLILYHREFPGCSEAPRPEECRNAAGEEQLLKEIHDLYRGKAVAAHDLDVY